MSLESANFWFDLSNAVAVFGAFLVVVGAYGIFKSGSIKEHFADVRVSANEAETARANESAANAALRASEADARAAEANNAASMVRLEADRANRMAADAVMRSRQLQQQTAALELKANEAELELEKERVERLKLEASVNPRRLAPTRAQTLMLALAKYSGKRVRLRSYALDVESTALGQQILSVLAAAGIQVDDRRMSESGLGSLAVGVHVSGDDTAMVVDLLSLLSVVGEIGVFPDPVPIGPGMFIQDDGSDVDATIFVGIKPMTQ